MPPARRVAVVACMDARLHVSKLLGLEIGDAHIIRNAGGVISDDVIRSLLISQRLLGTEEIILIHHTDCGMLPRRRGQGGHEYPSPLRARSFSPPRSDVRQSIARVKASPFLPHTGKVRGFVYDVGTGALREVT